MDLSTRYLGLNLRSPLVAAASPLSDELDDIRRMEDAGASAVMPLGAPIGSVLCGGRSFIQRARHVRKRLGGGMRQVGILAAGGLYALEHNRSRLAEDHRRARRLAVALAEIPELSIDPGEVETNILVKPNVASLLEREFLSRSWKPQVVALSGNTDCYQPIEQKLQLTRKCLEVFLSFRNPVSITTKNALIQRDLDLLRELAALNLVHVSVSVTTLNADLARTMEPRTPSPSKRLETINALARHGIPVGVNAAPMIPGLTVSEMPAILREAAQQGARFAGYSVLRLPYAVKDLVLDWLKREIPTQAPKVLSQIRNLRDGCLSCSEFGLRLKGSGPLAETVHALFETSCNRYRLNEKRLELSVVHFRRTIRGQLSML